jgi:hypothetical protein
MVNLTPVITAMSWIRLVVIVAGVVCIRHAMSTVAIRLRHVEVERGSDGEYRLITFHNGAQVATLIHGETAGSIRRLSDDDCRLA